MGMFIIIILIIILIFEYYIINHLQTFSILCENLYLM
jgi:hypothetical protein